MRKIVFPPFFGEFGWLILKHIRHVHRTEAEEKVVCCEKGTECLFPTATEFFYNWKNPEPDDRRCASGVYGDDRKLKEYKRELNRELKTIYQKHELDNLNYDCEWHTSNLIKFLPKVENAILPVDVAICARKRRFAEAKNWSHWPELLERLAGWGMTVGVVGAQETSFDLAAASYAWQHPGGATEGTVDLLAHCKLYIGTDSGVSHLAALMDTPSVIFRCPAPGNPDMIGVMQRANRSLVIKLPDSCWDDKVNLLDHVKQFVCGIKGYNRPPHPEDESENYHLGHRFERLIP